MVDAGLHGVEFIAANTDAQALAMSDADIKLISSRVDEGPRRGRRPDIAWPRQSESRDDIKEGLKGADHGVITAGEGGGPEPGRLP